MLEASSVCSWPLAPTSGNAPEARQGACSRHVLPLRRSCVAGMFIIISTLLALDRCSEDGADRLLTFFNPALNWIQRWLPLFYVPTLVVLPVALEGIAGKPCLNSSPCP